MNDDRSDGRQRLRRATAEVATRSYAPYSGFNVAAAVLTAEGEVFAGVNVENVAFPSGQCAEATAIGNMVTNVGARSIVAVAVRGPGETLVWPCGNCRQKLVELAAPECSVLAISADGAEQERALADLLPFGFTEFESQ
ncbi:cytidine deaminase [Salinisphaera sp. SPP-AMP-43]|uniref:cytidine deaminase n=1 Tax=Salinisphaera sp. SPP-AMP-43 TaxID=3121288 RepID=UPI003C6E477A